MQTIVQLCYIFICFKYFTYASLIVLFYLNNYHLIIAYLVHNVPILLPPTLDVSCRIIKCLDTLCIQWQELFANFSLHFAPHANLEGIFENLKPKTCRGHWRGDFNYSFFTYYEGSVSLTPDSCQNNT